MSTYDEAEMLMAKSRFEAAGIPHFVPGEALQDLIGNRLVSGSNLAIGPMQILVPVEHAEEAKGVLQSPPAAEESEG